VYHVDSGQYLNIIVLICDEWNRNVLTNNNLDDQGTAGKAAVRFVSYDTIRNFLSDEHGKLSAGGGLLAGMAAGAVESVLAVTPTERIKTALWVFP
jgi:hypothetical protein